MRYGLIGIAALILLILAPCTVVFGKTELQVHQTLHLEKKPLDMLIDNRIQRVYVLNEAGEILVYGFNGRIKGKVDVGPDVVQIKAGPRDGMLFLLSRQGRSIQSISINVTETIDITGSPLKGDPDAPVTIVVFSDFQ